ncbi:hypothetical protein [Anaerobiospirillum thomasii]|uniref:Glutamate--tRNA ligase n=1 Tax=Anaerobiospirillum thomasii TaxID=179995 RepID=A0A2X0WHW0_9GAMM|nr:hypothetical protein [Anaerobiospirillum thomasii]SPT78890.1 Glutamate--tRNA ligase [Anaerobiospirillum thomasii]
MEREGLNKDNGPDPVLVVKAYAERCQTLKEMAQKARCYYEDFSEYDAAGVKKWIKEGSIEVLERDHLQPLRGLRAGMLPLLIRYLRNLPPAWKLAWAR